MRIELNGESVMTTAKNLAELIEERGLEAQSVATALNGSFVPRGMRDQAILTESARIEVLSPMQGG